MKFSFELLNVLCKRTLSTDDSDWAKSDGIRVYFLVITPGGYYQTRVSGREWPPPDTVDNYSFVPGESLNLRNFPPQGWPNWVMPPAALSDTDFVGVAVIGVNEGLSYIAGGGGGAAGKAGTLAAFEEITKQMAEKASEHGGGPVSAAVWGILDSLLEKLNHTPDCRGVAFAYTLELTLKKLLHDHLVQQTSTHVLSTASATGALGRVAMSKRSPGCGSPDYEVGLRITRVDDLYIAVDDQQGTPRQGQSSLVPVRVEECRPNGPMHTWPEYVDRTIKLTPSHSYPSLKPTWCLDGRELTHQQGTVSLMKPGDPSVGDSIDMRLVPVRYERVTSLGIEHLILRTVGEDGNYRLEVSLRFNFEGVHPEPPGGPWVTFRTQVVWVTGQTLGGNSAFSEYVTCVIRRQISLVLVNYMPEAPVFEPPGPVERHHFERLVTRIVLPQILAEHLEISAPRWQASASSAPPDADTGSST